MLDDKMILDLRPVLQAQQHVIQRIRIEMEDISTSLNGQNGISSQIKNAEALLTEIESKQAYLEEDDLVDFDSDDIYSLYNRHNADIRNNLKRIEYTNWNSFVRNCQVYALSHEIDPFQPYEAFLTDADIKKLEEESYANQFRWDKLDYIFVGASGILAALTDFLLVKIPRTMGQASAYAGQKGSPLTAWLRNYTENEDGWFAKWSKSLEDKCKVPYDSMSYADDETIRTIRGMSGRTHRLQTLGHDPLLGFIFGVLDIMRGTITGFSYNHLTGCHQLVKGQVWSNLEPIGLIESVICHIKHLISDVGTRMGLQMPLFTLLQGINIPAPLSPKNRKVGQIARWMYLNGYDFRHFLVSGITPAVIEIVLRGYLMLRHYSENGETKLVLANNPKYRSMLLTAHGIAAAANAGKVALYQGNPLSINYAEWLAFIRYLIPHTKYWLFDKHRLKIEHMERINEAGWNELRQANDAILLKVAASDFQMIELGKK